MLAEIRGEALRIDHRSGRKTQPDGTFNDWEMDIVTVLVERKGTSEVILPRNRAVIDHFTPREGDKVSFLVEVVRSERGFNTNVLGNSSDFVLPSTASAYATSDS